MGNSVNNMSKDHKISGAIHQEYGTVQLPDGVSLGSFWGGPKGLDCRTPERTALGDSP
jgi:hypothetical protein